MKWLAVQPIAKGEEPYRRMNSLHKCFLMLMLLIVIDFAAELAALKTCYYPARASSFQMHSNTTKKFFRRAFDKNIDLASATETFPRIESHQDRLTGSKNFSRPQRHLFFQASRTQRADCFSILANQHSRSWPAI